MYILGTYRLEFFNSRSTCIKNLVSTKEFNENIKPQLEKIKYLENNFRHIEADILLNSLNTKYGKSFFTEDSPVYKAIETGILDLPKIQGGKMLCLITKI